MAHHDRAPGAGAAGTIDAAGAHDRIGVSRLDGHRCGKGQDGGKHRRADGATGAKGLNLFTSHRLRGEVDA